MNDKELDELFSGKLKPLQIPPDDHVWKGIVLELDGVKRTGNLWQVILAAIVIAAIMMACVIVFLKTQETKTPAKQTNPSIIVDKQEALSSR